MKTGVKYSVIGVFSLICFIEASYRCDYTYSSSAKGYYKYVAVPATWMDAHLRCALEGATLASPTKPEIEMRMKDIVNTSPTKSEIFTGIHSRFSRGNFHTIEGVPLSEISITWAKNEPNNVGNDENCITFNENGELADRLCNETRPYICYRSSDKNNVVNECGTVDPEYKLDQRTGSCYKVHKMARSFERAHFACSAEGGHLAITNSDVEVLVIREVFSKYPAAVLKGDYRDLAFVGLREWSGDRDEWRTIFGQSLAESGFDRINFNINSRDLSCVVVDRNGNYHEYYCDRHVPFICEKSPKHPALCQESRDEPEYDY